MTLKNLLRPSRLALICLAAMAAARPCSADFQTFTTTGDAGGGLVSSTATFTTLGNGQLQVVLTNNLAATDPLQVLTAVVFSVAGSGPGTTPLALISGAPTSGSQLLDKPGQPTASQDLTLDGRWGFLNNTSNETLRGGVAFEYGLAATGAGDVFPGGLGNGDYGIIGFGSDLNQNNFKSKLPLVMSVSTQASSATFVLGGFGNLSASQITGVSFSYGSAGDNLPGTSINAVPEPASLAMVGLNGLAALGLVARRRRKAARA